MRLLNEKIIGPAGLKRIIPRLKAKDKKIVFTNGCFDLLHYGHVKYLQDAKKLGDILVVGVNSDASVRRLKGKPRPVVNEKDRQKVLAALESVDYAVIFGEDTPLKLIIAVDPDILVKGSDWSADKIVGADFVKSRGGSVKAIKFIKGRSTSALIKKIAKKS